MNARQIPSHMAVGADALLGPADHLAPPTNGCGNWADLLTRAARRAAGAINCRRRHSSDPHGGLQSLEQRRLMSASVGASFESQTLLLQGHATSDNELRVELDSDGSHIRGVVNGDAGDWLSVNNVRHIHISGGEGDDHAHIDTRISDLAPTFHGEELEQVTAVVQLDGQSDLQAEVTRNAAQRYAESLAVELQVSRVSVASAETQATAAQSAVPTVGRVAVIDADRDRVVDGMESIGDHVTIDLGKLDGHQINFLIELANAPSGFNGSVKIKLGDRVHVENVAPYAVFANERNDFYGWVPEVGDYTLEMTVYTGKFATGEASQTQMVRFTVVETPKDPVVEPPVDNGSGGNHDTPMPRQDATAPEARITAVMNRIVAGQSLHVSALSTVLHHGEWNDATFEWEFGDGSSKFNKLRGFVGAHLYETAGTYTVTLTVTDETGRVGQSTMQVHVAASQRTRIYVSNWGDDANDGLSTSSPVRSVERAMALLEEQGDHAELLFRSGQTHQVRQTISINHSDVVLGSYGSGSKPLLQWRGGFEMSHSMIVNQEHTRQVTVRGLAFDAPGTRGTGKNNLPTAFVPIGDNTSFINNTLHNVTNGVLTNAQPIGVLVQGNQAMDETGLRAYMVWGEGKQLTILGNKAINSTREHIVRLSNVEGVTIAGNEFDNLDRRSVDSGDYDKGVITMQKGSFGYVSNNLLHGPAAVGPLGDGDGLVSPGDRWYWAVWENNTLNGPSFTVEHGAAHIDIRYNVFHNDNGWAMSIHGYNADYNRTNTDITVHGNIAINNGTRGQFLHVYNGAREIEVTDNTYIAPNLEVGPHQSAGMAIDARDLSSFTRINGNIWPDVGDASSWARGGINFFGTGDASDMFYDADRWNALPKVGEDQFLRLDPSAVSNAVLNVHGVPVAMAA